jgi:hypothetical protein
MLRYLFVFVTVLPFMFLFNTTEMKKEELKVEIIATNSAEPETEFTVKLKITGGDVKGFAKYADRMPEGTEASAVSIGDATFTADNGQIKIIWLEFPEEDEVILEYKVKLLKSSPSLIQIGGKFSYLENNEKRMLSVFKKSIAIGYKELANKEAEKKEEPAAISVNINRRVVSSRENVHKIEITLSQTGIQDFGKIQEFLPMGAEIEEGETVNAAFSSIKNKVKFVWMSIPEMETFVVTYLVDLTNADNKDIKSITGSFSYLDNNSASKKADINFGDAAPIIASNTNTSKESDLKSEEKETKQTIADENKTPINSSSNTSAKSEEKIAVVTPEVAVAENGTTNIKSKEEEEKQTELATQSATGTKASREAKENLDDVFEDTTPVEKVEAEVAVVEEVIEKDNEYTEPKEDAILEVIEETAIEETVAEEKEESTIAQNTTKVKPVAPISNIPVINGVKYRVQIAAGANVVDAVYFEQRHKFETAFNIENHQGWVKYTTGSHSMYKDARDSREVISSAGHEFDGPFVTAYNDGTRITVQEALMISSQKWFK